MKANRFGQGYSVAQMAFFLMILCLVAMSVVACNSGEQLPEEGETVFPVLSPAFQDGARIPVKYTCQGQDVSVPLTWSDSPPGTDSFALIMDDADAPGGAFAHWILFNIPSNSRELPEAMPAESQLPSGALQGKNDFGRLGYSGPCPPPGPSHQYRFTVYALDQPLNLEVGASRMQVVDSMKGHILGQGQLTGTYQL